MSKIAKFVGIVWASPLTLLGMIYVFLFSALGWYEWEGRHGNALTWQLVPERAPDWLLHMWLGWTGHAVGNIVIVHVQIRSLRGQMVIRHEQAHVEQAMTFGVFYPIIYAFMYLVSCMCRSSYPLYDNVLEISARRSAGQVIDVIGTMKRAIAMGKIKVPLR